MEKEKSSTTHKVLTIIGIVLCVILIPILIINVTLIIKSYTNKDEVPGIGGICPLIVLTDSMDPKIKSGDLIFVHTIDGQDVKEKDIIAFFDPAGNGTSVVTHRVIEIIDDGDGTVSFRTRGDNNNTDDKVLVPEENLVGEYKTRIPLAGHVAMFMQTTPGLIVCVVLPIILLVAYDIIRRKMYEKTKQDDTQALLAELERLKAEKAAQEAMATVVSDAQSVEDTVSVPNTEETAEAQPTADAPNGEN
ncbi:MAG: signal peptidase I [Ruminococcaceae bacterium]|nr:signal peptidase I [Oscillospiraceae bacterium]